MLLTHVGDSGVVHSDALHLIERYNVDQETGNLVFRWEATDSNYFSAPIRGGVSLSPTSLEVGVYDCKISDQIEGER